MKRVLVCCDSFKGTMSSFEVNEIISSVLINEGFDCQILPMADGGEGSLDIIQATFNTSECVIDTFTADNTEIKGSYYTYGNKAYIDTASASGLIQVKSENRNPMNLSSYGTGLLFKHAIENGIKQIDFFMGGSATVDGGVGLLYGLIGEKIPDKNPLMNFNPEVIEKAQTILKEINVNLITDVSNPILGITGAAKVFGPQKGASFEEVNLLELYMQKWVYYLGGYVNVSIHTIKGVGSAGGIGLPFITFCRSLVYSGYEYFRNILNYSEALNHCDILITGEGCIDEQTMMGKGPGQLANEARSKGKTIIGIGGMVKTKPSVFDKVFSTSKSIVNEVDMRNNAKERLKLTANQVVYYLKKC